MYLAHMSNPETAPDLTRARSVGRIRSRRPGCRQKDRAAWPHARELGRVRLTRSSERRAALRALYESFYDSGGLEAICHWPRHLLRARRGRDHVEIAICFMCGDARVPGRIDGVSRSGKASIGSRVLRLRLNRRLARGGVRYEIDLDAAGNYRG